MKIWLITISVVFLIVLLWFANDWLALFDHRVDRGEIVQNVPSVTGSPISGVSENDKVSESVEYQIEEVATGLNTVWSIIFTSPERMLLSERPGTIRVVESGTLAERPLHTFSGVSSRGEIGLMSLAVDPDYDDNKFIYASMTYSLGASIFVKVVRLQDNGDSVSDETTIIDSIPAAINHAGCRIAFGPDEKLYITTGDATNKKLPQDLKSLGGKILRINSDGSIPNDNPFPESPVWSYGHRNAQGIAWSTDGEMYSSEHGPTVFDGPAGGDEVNHIIKGANYGWPVVSHERSQAGMVSPLQVFTPAEAPASLMIYSGKVFPQYKDQLFFGALVGEGMVRLHLGGGDAEAIAEIEKLKSVDFGRIREVMEGPDGLIYFSTSNRDGRGTIRKGDDRVLRMAPSV